MTTFEFVKDCIKKGYRVAVKTKSGRWKVLLLNDKEKIQGTHPQNTIEESLAMGLSGLSIAQCDEKAFNEFFTDEYKFLSQKLEPYKVGDRVRVHEIVKEYKGFIGVDEATRKMAGKEFTIKIVLDLTNETLYSSGDGFFFPHYYLIPVKEEIEEMTLEEVCKELGREIKIKK